METVITPADLQSAYLDGMWHGGLGVGLIIFGIIGWPATRYVLGILTYPFTRRPAREPIGSAYWDKYSSPHMQTGFDFSGANLSGRKK